MNDRRMTVHEVADLTGITIRTLHYYDEIGLLKPTMVTDSKYRLYTDDDLSRLQEILFFREVGFALKEIKSLLGSPNYDRTEALKRHLDILQAQKDRIDALISLVKTEIEGNPVPSFAPFSDTKVLELKEKYRSEVLERWGNTHSFKEYEAAFLSQPEKGQRNQLERFLSVSKDTFEKLAQFQAQSPACQEVQQIVKEWQQYISESFYECDNQILHYLGQLYISDQRFSNYINGFGNENLASFFSDAINVFVQRTKSKGGNDMDTEWLLCPVCGSKTRLKIRDDTVLENFPLYCPKCKHETLIAVRKMKMSIIKEPDAQTQSR